MNPQHPAQLNKPYPFQILNFTSDSIPGCLVHSLWLEIREWIKRARLCTNSLAQFICLAETSISGSFIASFICKVTTYPAGKILPITINYSTPPATKRALEPYSFPSIIAGCVCKKNILFNNICLFVSVSQK